MARANEFYPVNKTVQVSFDVTKYRILEGENLAILVGFVGDYEVSLYFRADDPRVLEVQAQQRLTKCDLPPP